jgi:hypothetical protein
LIDAPTWWLAARRFCSDLFWWSHLFFGAHHRGAPVAIFANLWLEESIEVQSVARHQGPEGLVGLVGLVAGMVNKSNSGFLLGWDLL